MYLIKITSLILVLEFIRHFFNLNLVLVGEHVVKFTFYHAWFWAEPREPKEEIMTISYLLLFSSLLNAISSK